MDSLPLGVDLETVFLYVPAALVWSTGALWFAYKWRRARRRRTGRRGGSFWWRHLVWWE